MRTPFSNTIFVCALAIALLGCEYRSGITKPTAAQVAGFVHNASITLPASAQPVGWRELPDTTNVLWLQVRMPASDVAVFLASSPFNATTLATNSPYKYHTYDFGHFWQRPPRRYRAAQNWLPNGTQLHMVIDDSNSTNALLYLMWRKI